MNESVDKDLQDSCKFNEYIILCRIIKAIEETPDKKQKDAIIKIIDEEIE